MERIGIIKVAAPAELPRTGQTTSYATGDDGNLQKGVAWPNPRFMSNADSTVTDILTGLIWTADAGTPTFGTCAGGAKKKTWQGALDYVVCLNTNYYLGHADWRLPNVNELRSITNAGQSDSAAWLNTQGFSNVQDRLYWSSTTSASSTIRAWFVCMYDGLVRSDNKDDYFCNVWPVRSVQSGSLGNSVISIPKTGQTTSYAFGDDGDLQIGVAWPNPRFTPNADSTVTDILTGLIWTADAGTPTFGSFTGGPKGWEEALDFVSCLNTNNYLGHADWRLPNVNELRSITNAGKSDSAAWLNTQGFSNVQSIFYWLSTTTAINSDNAWIVSMNLGYVKKDNKGFHYYVWPVRSGK